MTSVLRRRSRRAYFQGPEALGKCGNDPSPVTNNVALETVDSVRGLTPRMSQP